MRYRRLSSTHNRPADRSQRALELTLKLFYSTGIKTTFDGPGPAVTLDSFCLRTSTGFS
ncbi:hypothetical protein MPLA_290056 [Mesorhizobium sp. ORS 3359]|nr:hypothetical protein MPLA_290056 [Mesorhizobium sp. ORS 3359]